MRNLYILDKWGRPKVCHDVIQWASWWETTDRSLVYTEITNKIRVDTSFLGIDHNFSDKGKPILWETMIFGGPHDGWSNRYASTRDARKGHKEAVKLARGRISDREPIVLPKAKAKKRG